MCYKHHVCLSLMQNGVRWELEYAMILDFQNLPHSMHVEVRMHCNMLIIIQSGAGCKLLLYPSALNSTLSAMHTELLLRSL